MRNVILLSFLFFSCYAINAQPFEKLIGNSSNNRLGKMILHSNHYYVLGQNGNKATVTKMGLNGNVLWTNQTNEDGWWNDVIVNKDGNLMTVGYQGNVSNQSDLNSSIGIINVGTGSFVSIRVFNFGYRDLFSRIFQNPMPSNSSFPYYIIGLQIDQSASNADKMSVNMVSENGIINSRRLISGPDDLETHQGLWINSSTGDFVLSGNKYDGGVFEGAAVNFDKHATSTLMTEINKPVRISNILQIGFSYIYSGQTTDTPQKGIIWKQVGNTNYSYTIDGLSNILNIFLDPNGTILYVFGVETAAPNRRVLLTLDNTQNTIPITGTRYYANGETTFNDGFANLASNQRIMLTDSRTGNPNTLGQQDGLSMVLDLSLQNCLSETISGFILRPYEITTSIGSVTNIANTPSAPQIFTGTTITYQTNDPCAAPCNISLQVNKSVDPCSNATFTGIATGGTGPFTYQWDISCNGVDGTTNPFTTQIGPGTIPFCVTVTDATGCTAVLNNQTVVGVRDLTKPLIDCPDDIQITNNPGRCFATFAPVITVTDNCDPEPNCTCTMTGSTSGNMPKNTLVQFNVGTTTVTCTATDVSGNVSDACTFTVIVADTQKPTIVCPPNISISCDQNVNNTMITGQATASDNCPEVIVTYTDSFNGNACSGTITRTWKATDASGNMSTCIQIIVIEDKVAPAISCPAFITINCDQQPLPSLTGTPQVVDNCQAGIVPTYTDNNIGTGCDRYIQRIWTANDGCGNIMTCTQNIYFNDQIAPVVVCPPNLTITCLPADWQMANFGTATGTDNCGSVTISNFERTFSGSNCNGTITSKWRAIDPCGIQNECFQTITVIDNIAPTITCPPNLTLSCNATTTPSSTGMATATDNCTSNVNIRPTDAFTHQGCTQNLIRTWTATDACGNVDTCVQTITLIDTILPNVVCPPDLTLSCGANTSSAFTGEPTVSDFCQSNLIVTYTDINSGPPCDVTITRTWTVNDGCGNVSTCIQTIKVEDKTPPTLICPPSNVNPIECTANPNLGVPTNVMDNCGGKIDRSKVDIFSTNGCFTTVTRTWTVTDQCGNNATCDQVILMQDTKAPIITNCGRKITVQGVRNPDGICYGNVTISTPDVTDACSSNVTITNSFNNTSDASSGNYPVGQTIVTWTAKDDCGLMTMCVDTVVVVCESDESFCGWAAATCYANSNSDPVGVLYNVSNTSTAPIGNDWTGVNSIHPSMWTKSQIGDVFGICFDNANNVYLAATDVYNLHGSLNCTSGIAGDAGIYVTNLSLPNFTSIFVKTINSNSLNPVIGNYIPNTGGTGNAIGNIAYDKFNNQFFATNLEDGRIYRISPSGNLLSSYDPFSNDVPSNGICPNGESNWGVAINKDPITNQVKLYFARSKNLTSNPKQIWSVELLPSGEFSGAQLSTGSNIFIDSPSEILEIDNIPGSQNIITDIEFSNQGNMLIAERGQPHNSNVYQYTFTLNWNLLNNLKVGYLNSGQNSAGGVDFGYINYPSENYCNEIVWATGNCMDPINLPGTTCQVYGIEGINPLGNSFPSNNMDLYIDFNGAYSTSDKFEIGDVDIYKCNSCVIDSTDCNSLSASINELSSGNDTTCCYSVNLTNNVGPEVTKVCIGLIDSPLWGINTSTINSPGFNWSTIGSGMLCIENPNGIPAGTTSNVFEVCLTEMSEIARDTQCLVVSWWKGEIMTECTDTLKTYCGTPTLKDTCFNITNISATCSQESDYAYCVSMTVTNIGSYSAYGFVLSGLPATYSYGDCGCSGSVYGGNGWAYDWFSNPLLPGQSRIVCVKITSALPILDTTQLCFNGSIEGLRECCKRPFPICVNLEPCCNPCNDISIVSHKIENQDSCCYAIDLRYNCDYQYFNSVTLDVLNPDVHFGSYNVSASGWNLCPSSNSQHICASPSLGSISSGVLPSLVTFCLTDIDDPSEVPQFVQIGFNTLDSQGRDSIACDTVLRFECIDKKDPCVFITNEQIECIPDSNKYKITVTVQNLSNPNFTAGFLTLFPLAGISPNPIPLTPPLPNDGSTRTVTFCYTPPVFPDVDGKLVLVYKLTNLIGDSCCNGNQVLFDTLMLPECGPIPCGYICDDDDLSNFDVENQTLGALNAPPSGWYKEYNKPTIVADGCNGTSRSLQLAGVTRGYLGEGAGVRINGFTGPVNLLEKGRTYCIKFCAKVLFGLASTSGYLRIRATDGSPLSYGTCLYPSCEIVKDVILTNQNVWDEITVFYTPTQNYNNLVFSNQSISPLDVPSVIRIDALGINSAIPVYNDLTPPSITCPMNTTITDINSDCIIQYTIPVIPVSDDNGISTFQCYLNGSPVTTGSTHSINNSMMHVISCVAYDVCGNVDSCQYTVVVDCKPVDPICICPSEQTSFNMLHNGVNYSLVCNQPLSSAPRLGCPPSDVTITGTFACHPSIGQDSCKSLVGYVLDRPGGLPSLVWSSTISPMVSATFAASTISTPGIYSLTVSTICPGSSDTCRCVIQWIQMECPVDTLCKCGGFSKTKFCLLSTGTAVETECNLENKVYNLPCPGTSLVNYCGTFKCNPDTCSPPAVNFVLTNTNTGATIHTANLTLNAMGKFTINLLPGWCNDPSVIYEIKVSGVCGNDTCVCITKFKVECPQKNLCKCDDKFFADVAQGFLQSSVVGNCIRKFDPRSLCPSDKVEWYRNGVLISTTTGMTSSTFPLSVGFGDVCMIVTRTESPNVICRDTFCSRIYCKPEVSEKCDDIDNSEMVNNIDGYIDDDGTMTNWTKDEGWPYAFANEGLSDGNIMLIASKDMPSSARTNRNGAPPKQGFLTFELDAESYLSTSIPEGSILMLEGITSTGQRLLLSDIDVAGIRKGWYGTIKRDISMPAEIYSVVLRLSTNSTEPVLLRIDNFCIYQTVGTNDIQNELSFSIYPNPTTGQLTIQFSSTLEQDISLKVFDILGRELNNGFIQKGNSSHNFSIEDMAGIYIIQLTDSLGNTSQRKVIKID